MPHAWHTVPQSKRPWLRASKIHRSRQSWCTFERSSRHAQGVGVRNASLPFASHVLSQQMRHTGAEAEEGGEATSRMAAEKEPPL